VSNKKKISRKPDTAGAVTLAYVHPNEVSHSWHQSIMALIGHDIAGSGRIARGGYIAIRCGTDGLPSARNAAVLQFLEEEKAEWLFWIDTDMGFEPDIVDRLAEAAHPTERPIMGALCFSNRQVKPDGFGGYVCRPQPTIYDWARISDEKQGFVHRQVYEPDTVTECAGTGSAAIVIHRTVFEKIEAEHGPTWYNRTPEGYTDERGVRRMLGEDLSFCIRAGVLGIPVHVHTGVKTTHMKTVWIAEQDYLDRWTLNSFLSQMAEQQAEAKETETST